MVSSWQALAVQLFAVTMTVNAVCPFNATIPLDVVALFDDSYGASNYNTMGYGANDCTFHPSVHSL